MPNGISKCFDLKLVWGADIYLRSLDMVVKVISKSLNVRDSFLAPLWSQMPREENYILSTTACYLMFISYQKSRIQLLRCFHRINPVDFAVREEAHSEKAPVAHFV